jgi:hypothetical protein
MGGRAWWLETTATVEELADTWAFCKTWNRMFQGRTGTASPSHMRKRLHLRSTIHHLQSHMIRVHSRFENHCKSRRCGAASPYRQKRQDFKRQDSREEAGSPSFTPMPTITHNISTFLFCVPLRPLRLVCSFRLPFPTTRRLCLPRMGH